MDTKEQCQICCQPGYVSSLACHETHKMCAPCTNKLDLCPFCRTKIPGRGRYLPEWAVPAMMLFRYVVAPLLQPLLPPWLWESLIAVGMAAFWAYSAYAAVRYLRRVGVGYWWRSARVGMLLVCAMFAAVGGFAYVHAARDHQQKNNAAILI
jgi:hypothetical protein